MKNTINKNSQHNSVRTYIIGFILSLILTLTAYFLVEIHQGSFHELISHEVLIPAVIICAILQLFVQLIFFLHLHKGSGSRWHLVIFLSAVSIILLIVVGSLWIMNNLNYNMTPESVSTHMQNEEGIHKTSK